MNWNKLTNNIAFKLLKLFVSMIISSIIVLLIMCAFIPSDPATDTLPEKYDKWVYIGGIALALIVNFIIEYNSTTKLKYSVSKSEQRCLTENLPTPERQECPLKCEPAVNFVQLLKATLSLKQMSTYTNCFHKLKALKIFSITQKVHMPRAPLNLTLKFTHSLLQFSADCLNGTTFQPKQCFLLRKKLPTNSSGFDGII